MNKNSLILKDFFEKNKTCNIIESILPAVDKIIAIGDIHGDFKVLIKALQLGEVIDDDNNWIGGNTYVVQVGDVFDKGGRNNEDTSLDVEIEEIKILHFLYELNKKAIPNGGKVISLLGNHELMNMLGDFRYASNNHIESMGGYENRKDLLKPGGDIAKRLACNSLGIVQIGDWLFVHGGLLPEHIQGKTLRERKEIIYRINNVVRQVLLGELDIHNIGDFESDIIFGSNGIFWTRDYSGKTYNSDRCSKILETLELLDINKETGGIVIGHTPQPNINSDCNNKIWKIDTGMSTAFGENNALRIEVLLIKNNGELIKPLKRFI